ncbi:MAG: hypothetical protein EA425_17905 [Puniceicoccaceae bacterium]|nr:MAG: hypothetical protein EA425_17905 [Puniceicoccaceae bacterium]
MPAPSSPATRAPDSCVICGDPLPAHQKFLKASYCFRATCRQQFNRFRPDDFCAVCGILLPTDRRGRGLCSDFACTLAHTRRETNRIQQRLREQSLRLRREAGRSLGLKRPASYPLVTLPSTRARPAPLPEERREAFRRHLEQIIAAADLPPTPGEADDTLNCEPINVPPKLAPVLEQGCATCRGFCCLQGGTHAFLKPASIRRYREHWPGVSAKAMVEDYLSHIPEKPLINSCVFHGEKGCTLPRQKRASICNLFYCGGLLRFLLDRPKHGRPRAFLIATEHDTINAAGFTDSGSALPLSLPPKQGT